MWKIDEVVDTTTEGGFGRGRARWGYCDPDGTGVGMFASIDGSGFSPGGGHQFGSDYGVGRASGRGRPNDALVDKGHGFGEGIGFGSTSCDGGGGRFVED